MERLTSKIDDALWNHPDDDRLIDWRVKVSHIKESHRQRFVDPEPVQFDFSIPMPS